MAAFCILNTAHVSTNEAELPEEVTKLLQLYQDIFKEPKGLPPSRPCDHSIPLVHRAQPFNLSPYRYSFDQKNVIENIVGEMLKSQIVVPNHSCFASPALLVRKKDNTWRLCVDYRRLNSLTVKNKYPIPMVEDLLDELNGSKIFLKVDLRSGYHQVRMRFDDEPKTAFRTHHGLWQFRVMPFGLTNAPTTFQSLMHQVFGPYLKKFILVFFDDILIYSLSVEDHLKHLQVVL